jgi:hypothetical protein
MYQTMYRPQIERRGAWIEEKTLGSGGFGTVVLWKNEVSHICLDSCYSVLSSVSHYGSSYQFRGMVAIDMIFVTNWRTHASYNLITLVSQLYTIVLNVYF